MNDICATSKNVICATFKNVICATFRNDICATPKIVIWTTSKNVICTTIVILFSWSIAKCYNVKIHSLEMNKKNTKQDQKGQKRKRH